jgi:hypothetical protein
VLATGCLISFVLLVAGAIIGAAVGGTAATLVGCVSGLALGIIVVVLALRWVRYYQAGYFNDRAARADPAGISTSSLPSTACAHGREQPPPDEKPILDLLAGNKTALSPRSLEDSEM